VESVRKCGACASAHRSSSVCFSASLTKLYAYQEVGIVKINQRRAR
jgi:hypothetical protein